MALEVAVLTRIVERHATQQALIRQRVLNYVTAQWRGLTSWRDADIDAFVARVVPVVEGGQLQVAAITDGYLAAVEQTVRGGTVRPIGVPSEIVNDTAMRGVPTSEVYSRAGTSTWYDLSRGIELAQATSNTLARMQATVATDLQLAHTHSARHIMDTKPYVVGHRRILTGSKSCRLCVTASTQRYRKADLSPIHSHCDCKVGPIYGTEDPGQVINKGLLDELKQSGSSGDLSLSQNVTRAKRSHADAGDRVRGIDAQLAVEQDPARRHRLEQQRADWQRREVEAEAKIGRAQDQLDDYRGENGKPKTVVVHEHGEIGPVLTDAEHKFTSAGDIR